MKTRNGKIVYDNTVHIEGYLYDNNLEVKVTGEKSKHPGTEYLTGSISIATDEELTNIIQVFYRYVVPMTASGKPNNTYKVLNDILERTLKSVVDFDKETAAKLRIDAAINLNEWYAKNEPDKLISQKRAEGGFIHEVTDGLCDENKRSTFEVDMFITKANRLEHDEERELPERVILKGGIFDFRNSLLPVELTVLEPRAMDYFESLEASTSSPIFTKLRGKVVSNTVIKKIEEESAFGEAFVREVPSSRKDFVVTWAPAEPYAWDTPETLTATELKEMIAARETYLAELKANSMPIEKTGAASTATDEPYNF